MAKTMRLMPKVYSDAALVEGLLRKDSAVEKAFYVSSLKYFNEHYRGVFFVSDFDKDDVFQESFITLWDNIERGKIYVRNGVLMGKGDEPFRGSLNTYLMAIAKLKYKEMAREESKELSSDDLSAEGKPLPEAADTSSWMNGSEDLDMYAIVAESLKGMSKGCQEILTMFYEQNMKLDDIVDRIGSYNSKDAVKTAKNKCLAKLRAAAVSLYDFRRNN